MRSDEAFPEPPKLTVARERVASLRHRHPWVFSGAIKKPPRNLPSGVIVDLVDEQGRFLARGSWNDESQIVVRVLSFRAGVDIDADFIRGRVADAVARREPLRSDGAVEACRLVFAEADRLPGLIVDRYGDWLVMQILTAGMEVWRDEVVEALAESCSPRGIFERSDSEDRRRHEGLGLRSGTAWGEDPPEEVVIREHGVVFGVDLRAGQKTGYYLDQRDNRRAVAAYCAGKEVLDAFSYTGGFGIHAARAGATRVTHLDQSQAALDLARSNVERNGLSTEHEYIAENVFDALRRFRDEGREFDVVILDPPKFAATKRQLDKAKRGYRDLNNRAIRLLREGGTIASFSCSGAMNPGEFQHMMAIAAADASRQVQVMETLSQPPDHPILLSFPEGSYLNGLIGTAID